MADPKDDTIEFEAPFDFSDYFFARDQQQFDVQLASATHPGKTRDRNEDHYAVMRRTRSCEMLSTNLPAESWSFPEDEAYFLMVADGIGGAAFGDVASQLALLTLFDLSNRATSWVMKFSDLQAQDIYRRVDAYIKQIQETFRKYTDENPDSRGMGTTLTLALLLPPHTIIIHVGDSRAYLFRNGKLNQITRDQTMAQAMLEAGADLEDALRFQNLLLNSLGGDTDYTPAEVIHVELEAGDRLMLCTDGLSDLVDHASIASILSEPDSNLACNQLIHSALDQGGTDNITAILCDLLPISPDD